MSRVRLFLRTGGGALLLAGLLGLLLHGARLVPGYLEVDRLPLAYLAVGVAALGLSFAPEPAARAGARAIGLAFLALAAVAAIAPGLVGLGRLLEVRVDALETLFHLALGAWGARAGFAD